MSDLIRDPITVAHSLYFSLDKHSIRVKLNMTRYSLPLAPLLSSKLHEGVGLCFENSRGFIFFFFVCLIIRADLDLIVRFYNSY